MERNPRPLDGRASHDKVYPKGHTVIHAPSGAGVLRTIRYRKLGGSVVK